MNESSLYHPQLPELAALARALPEQPILANHCGGYIAIGPHGVDPADTFTRWRAGLRELAACPNVYLKLGGQAMSIRGVLAFHEQVLPPSSGELADAWRPVMETCIETFGAGRCMFESNFPVDKGMCLLRVVLERFEADRLRLLRRGRSVRQLRRFHRLLFRGVFNIATSWPDRRHRHVRRTIVMVRRDRAASFSGM